MSSNDLREAFNMVAEPAGYACQRALLDYARDASGEWQVLTFHGIGPSGPFAITSVPIPGDGDVNAVARQTAQTLIGA